MDILSRPYTPAEELTVFKEVSTSLSGYSSLRIRQEVSLPSSKSYLPSGLSQVTFCEKLGLFVSSPSTIHRKNLNYDPFKKYELSLKGSSRVEEDRRIHMQPKTPSCNS